MRIIERKACGKCSQNLEDYLFVYLKCSDTVHGPDEVKEDMCDLFPEFLNSQVKNRIY